ncbi:sensor histidine kinase [Aureibacter tunicatorum]|uniref:Sensor histidine kinase YesM n=1 Tax=Aureibacter tunicatorum TaxID=866807 RepID=A0AAE3XLM3_9BACT|nr:histidine kinase [Aureibacter tunicatorum]MDR6237214.1 sensor histidine kinase YesM [Aureibacter tunicatorum]BDD06206.1 histidine kinase [Aureibacter tunicatorum]
MNRNTIYWSLQLFGWGAYALLIIFFTMLAAGRLQSSEIVNLFLTTSFFIISTHVYRLCFRRMKWMSWSIVKLVLIVLLSMLGLSVISYFFVEGIASLLLGELTAFFSDPFVYIGVIFTNMLFYLLWMLFYLSFHYFERYSTSLKYEAAVKEFELNRLKSQLNPHFIFNALNSTRALIDEDPKKAKDSVTQLSNILRSTLVMSKKKLINFSDELKTVIDYLALEKIRYEERLSVEYDINEDTSRFMIPPLMIQTLVENSIKHGISTLPSGGRVCIKAYVQNDKLFVEIGNDGFFLYQENNDPTKHGISNTLQRLNLIYGDDANFEIKNIGETWVVAKLEIPQKI